MSNGVLNARLSSAADFVRRGAVLADVGTDHAYLPIFLLERGYIERAVCSDINRGPLSSAERNAAAAGLSDKMEFVLCDGARDLCGRGITDYTICGMGGELIADIIHRAPHLSDRSVNLILQPMSRQEKLRRYLAASGFKTTHESYTLDAGKYYVCLLVTYDGVERKISDLEAITGPADAEIRGAEYRKKYLEAKLASLIRAHAGKCEAGTASDEDAALITALREHINLI